MTWNRELVVTRMTSQTRTVTFTEALGTSANGITGRSTTLTIYAN